MDDYKCFLREIYAERGWTIDKEEEDVVYASYGQNKHSVAKYLVKTDDIKDFVRDKQHYDNITIFVMGPPSSGTKKAETYSDNTELFYEGEWNVLKHSCQPKFEKLTVEEAKQIHGNFPFMKKSDPVAKVLRLKKNDIVRIIDKEDGSINYRRII